MIVKKDSELFSRLVPAVCEIYGDNLISLILYGSVARGTATDDSDIDIAVIVKTDDKAMYNDLMDVITDLDLEYDQVISTTLIEVSLFEKWKGILPYYRNIEEEGVRLWTAA